MSFINRDRSRRVLKANKPLLTLNRQDPFTVLKIGAKGLTIRLDGWEDQPEKQFSYEELNAIVDNGWLEEAIDDGGKITNKAGSDYTYESYKFAIVVHMLDRYAAYARFKMYKWK